MRASRTAFGPAIPLLLACVLGSVAPARSGAPYAELEREFEDAVEEFMGAYREAPSDAARQALLEDPTREPRQAFTPRFVEAAEAHRGSEEAVPFLVWLVRNGAIADGAVGEAAIATLLADHLDSSHLARLPAALYSLRDLRGLETTIRDLETVAAGCADPSTHARADLYRARALATYGAVGEARALLESLADEGEEVAAEASDRLAELAHPILGGPAPPLSGALARGGALREGDLAGRVVLVEFWGIWCGPCIAQLPELRAVHARYADRGLAMIGVNSDADLQQLNAFLEENAIGWRQLVDGSTAGPTAQAWRVRSWPASFLVSADGIVRYTDLTGADLEQAIEELLAERAGG